VTSLQCPLAAYPQLEIFGDHRVDRVLGFFLQSSKMGLSHPLTRRQVSPPPFCSGLGAHSLGGEGVRGSQFNDWRKSLALCFLCSKDLLLKFNDDIQTRRYYSETGDHVAVLEPGLQRSLCGRLRLL
jgi:hypothetical protein